MTPEFFVSQISRMKQRFSERAFDIEFTKLVGREVSQMSNEDFLRLVDVMVGGRKHTMPPTLTDFREMRLGIEKQSFNRDVQGAARAMNTQWTSNGLQAFLDGEYPGAKTLNDAKDIQILRNQIASAKNEL